MNNNSVLIATNPDDIHAASVLLAIRELGHKADILLIGDIPLRSSVSISLGEVERETMHIHHLDGYDALSNYGTFWFRRLSSPQMLTESTHPADREMALNESKEHIKALLHFASSNMTCVNGFSDAMYAEVKPNQLNIAEKVGLKFPRTLISNDPTAIRGFIGRFSNECGTIYKPYRTPFWQSSENTSLCYTSLVTLSDLPSDATLRLTPGIFQEYVSKKYELRIIWLGGVSIAVKIESQQVSGARIDWRAVQDERINLERIKLPSDIESKCTALMQSLSLRFGCIDMIVTEQGEYIFLEVNQMGQFLWIEDINPEIELFDAFVQFILNPLEFARGYKKFGLSYHEYQQDAQSFLKNLQLSRQSYLQSAFTYNE